MNDAILLGRRCESEGYTVAKGYITRDKEAFAEEQAAAIITIDRD